MTALSRPRAAPDPAGVATKALLRAATALGLAQREVGRVLGVSEASVSRLASGARTVDLDAKEGELALLFVRVFRSLDTLVGGSEPKARAWLDADNVHLGGAPRARILRAEGLVHVAQYLDAMRGKL